MTRRRLSTSTRSAPPGATRSFDAGFSGKPLETVQQGGGATLTGRCATPLATAPLCIFATVEDDS